jgi:hypothetical protein
MSKMLKIAATVCAIGIGAMVSAAASAQHWHGGGRVGIYFGVPVYAPFYYPAPYVYPYPYPPFTYAPAAPSVYVERGDAPPESSAQSAPPGVWYYCPDSQAYYPYVKECASPWQQVSPQPPRAAK